MMSTERWQLSNFNLKFLSPSLHSRSLVSFAVDAAAMCIASQPQQIVDYFDEEENILIWRNENAYFLLFCCVDVYLCWMSESFSSWLLSKSTYHCPLLPCNAPLLLSLTHKLSILRYSYRDSDAVIAMPSRRCRLHSSFSFHNFWTPWLVLSIS